MALIVQTLMNACPTLVTLMPVVLILKGLLSVSVIVVFLGVAIIVLTLMNAY